MTIMTSNGHNSKHFVGGTLRELIFTSISNTSVAPVLVLVIIN